MNLDPRVIQIVAEFLHDHTTFIYIGTCSRRLGTLWFHERHMRIYLRTQWLQLQRDYLTTEAERLDMEALHHEEDEEAMLVAWMASPLFNDPRGLRQP